VCQAISVWAFCVNFFPVESVNVVVNYFDIASYFDSPTHCGLAGIGIGLRKWFHTRKLVDTRSLRHPTTRRPRYIFMPGIE
jgi:hypothetical protein